MAETALLVPVPEAEQWVRSLRERFDPVAKLGIPAHITVLFPFVAPELITDSVLARVSSALGPLKSFAFTLQRIDRFPETCYLVPEPEDRFNAITHALTQEFPDCPPYGGRFAAVIPHLTVADRSTVSASIAQIELAVAMKEAGSIHATCRHVELFDNSSGYWRWTHSFPLAESPKTSTTEKLVDRRHETG